MDGVSDTIESYKYVSDGVVRMKAIVNGKIVTPDAVLEGKVLIFDRVIVGIVDALPDGCEVIDANGMYVSPGLIDVHIHGCMGFDVMDSVCEAVKIVSESIVKNGVTSFLPTTMTMEQEDVFRALESVRRFMAEDLEGARVLGAHLEGPFVNVGYKGAQDERFVRVPSWDLVAGYADVIRVVTYAPECDEGFDFTNCVMDFDVDIRLSMGHSGASFGLAMEAIRRGCGHVTHLFNAMSPMNHRDPGVVGAALMSDVFVELIADNVHVSPDMYQFVFDNKGSDRVVLITDSMRAGGMEDGDYDLGGQAVRVSDGVARLEDGTLAGSVLCLNDAVRNFYKGCDVSISDVFKMASLNPAKSIGVDGCKGSLEIGKDADIALFDGDFRCRMTICEGRVVFGG